MSLNYFYLEVFKNHDESEFKGTIIVYNPEWILIFRFMVLKLEKARYSQRKTFKPTI